MNLRKSDKIFVAGHRGLVGQAIVRNLQKRGYEHLIVQSRKEPDLLKTEAVQGYLKAQRPTVVFAAAAKVGGINANNFFRADFLRENLTIQDNVIWESKFIDSLRTRYKRDCFSAMPTNLYGLRDNFHLENGHALTALIRKIITAKDSNQPTVEIWRIGKLLREFMYSDDCADAIVRLTKCCNGQYFDKLGFSHINVATGQEISIEYLAHLIRRLVDYVVPLKFNANRPNGTPRKLIDCQNLNALGWKSKFSLEEDIRSTIDWYQTSGVKAL